MKIPILPSLVAAAIAAATVSRLAVTGPSPAPALDVPHLYRSHPQRSTDEAACVEMLIRGVKQSHPAPPTQDDLLREASRMTPDLDELDVLAPRSAAEIQQIRNILVPLLRAHGVLAVAGSPDEAAFAPAGDSTEDTLPAILLLRREADLGAVVMLSSHPDLTGARGDADVGESGRARTHAWRIRVHDPASPPPNAVANWETTLTASPSWTLRRADGKDWKLESLVSVAPCRELQSAGVGNVAWRSLGDQARPPADGLVSSLVSPHVAWPSESSVLAVSPAGLGAPQAVSMAACTAPSPVDAPAALADPREALAAALLTDGELQGVSLRVERAAGFSVGAINSAALHLGPPGCAAVIEEDVELLRQWLVWQRVMAGGHLPGRMGMSGLLVATGVYAGATDVVGTLGLFVTTAVDSAGTRVRQYEKALAAYLESRANPGWMAVLGEVDSEAEIEDVVRRLGDAAGLSGGLLDLAGEVARGQAGIDVLVAWWEQVRSVQHARVASAATAAARETAMLDAWRAADRIDELRLLRTRNPELAGKALSWLGLGLKAVAIGVYIVKRVNAYDGFAEEMDMLARRASSADIRQAALNMKAVAEGKREEWLARLGQSADEVVSLFADALLLMTPAIAARVAAGSTSAGGGLAISTVGLGFSIAQVGLGIVGFLTNSAAVSDHAMIAGYASAVAEDIETILFGSIAVDLRVNPGSRQAARDAEHALRLGLALHLFAAIETKAVFDAAATRIVQIGDETMMRRASEDALRLAGQAGQALARMDGDSARQEVLAALERGCDMLVAGIDSSLWGACPAEEAPAADALLLVLDTSGSMSGRLSDNGSARTGGTKIEALKEAALAFLDVVDPAVPVGVLAYQGGPCHGAGDLVAPISVDRGRARDAIRGLAPHGSTQMTGALQRAARVLRATPGFGSGRLILMSDGQDDCRGIPPSALVTLREWRIAVDTIGFYPQGQESRKGRRELSRIATATGGTYHEARSGAGLARAFRRAADTQSPRAGAAPALLAVVAPALLGIGATALSGRSRPAA